MCPSADENRCGGVLAKRYSPLRGGETFWIWRFAVDEPELVAARRGYPFHESDLPERAAAGGSGRAAILLRAVDPIGEPGVGGDMVELAVGKVVPVQIPGIAAVHADGGALVHPG